MSSVPHDPSWRLGVALQCQAALLAHHRLGEAVTRMATELAILLPCEAVVVGLATARATRVAGVAHGDGAPLGGEAATPYRPLLDEAMDQAARVEAPSQGGDPLQIRRAHLAWSRTRGQWVCTQPMMIDDEVVGAILVIQPQETPLNPEALAVLAQVAQLAAPVVRRLADDEAPLPRRLWHALRGARPVTHPGRWGMILGATVLVAVLVPVPATVPAQARIEGAVQRVVTAPEDGFIERALVRPGDEVSAGQVLVELADESLRIERNRLTSALQEHDNGFAAALAVDDRAQMAIHRARQGEINAQIAQIDHALARTRVRAPMDSVVLSGQLDQATGAPVSRGDVLLTLAPRRAYRLMLEVDERDARALAIDRAGELMLTSMPYDAMNFRITRIMPVTEQNDGRHFVRMEGGIEAAPGTLSPGMEGVARIEAGMAPLAVQATRRVREWLSLKLWMWTGA